MSQIRVVIYDCDGVLFDSRQSNEAFYNHILAHFGLPPMKPQELSFVHASTAEEAVDFLFKGDPRREEAQKYRLTMDYSPFVPLMRLEPHVKEVMQRLRLCCATAIATNRGLTMPLVMKEHGLEGLFDLTVTSLDVKEPKPHPECLLKILDHFRVPPGEALYVGDSEVDRLVAKRAGVCFVAYKNPGLEASYHIKDHREILEILDGKGRSLPGGQDS
ncbi:MAG: HAD hydrolase-like protein [bacterium]